MTKSIIPSEETQLQEAAKMALFSISQLIEIRETANSSALEIFHTLGSNIATMPFYKKGKKGQGELYEKIATLANEQSVGKSVSVGYLSSSVKFYEDYPKLSDALKIFEEKQLSAAIRNIPKLAAGKEEKEKVEKCKHCFHCPDEN
jgi:hypothetical protein